MANISASYGDMSAVATQLNTGEQTITADLQRLQSVVQQLVTAGFVTDQASKAFDESYSNFTKGAAQMMQGLNGMASYLNQAVTAMQDTDSSLANAIRSH
jgi:WXG100 family type VII secretion target